MYNIMSTPEQWIRLGIDIDGDAEGDKSGYSVSLSSDGLRVAIGAISNGDNGTDSGQVRVYEWDGSDWNQLGDDIDGDAAGDRFGHSVSLSSNGSIVAIGAPYNDGNDNSSGHVRVYEWDGSEWNQLGIDIDGEAEGDQSGSSVSLSSNGHRIAIGAPFNNGANGTSSGHVLVYELDGSTWEKIGNDIDGEAEGDNSGFSVSLSSNGTRVAIGASDNDDSGHVRVYELNGTTWEKLGDDIDGDAAGDMFGSSVSLSSNGTRVAIGAHKTDVSNDINRGQVQIREWDGSKWDQLGQDIDGDAAGDWFGHSVSLSSDGSRVAIGAFFNDGANGTNSGHVRVYELDGTTWNQLGIDIDGEAEGDQSGYSVSLSSDGHRVAIGAYRNDGDGSNSGHVRVYEWRDIEQSVGVSEGWNLISSPGTTDALILDNNLVTPGTLYGYGTNYSINTTGVLQPNKGYWVKCSSTGTLSLVTLIVVDADNTSPNGIINLLKIYFGDTTAVRSKYTSDKIGIHRSYNEDRISNWDTSNVTDMSNIFNGYTSFNKDISGWDTSSVDNMSNMFNGCTSFNQDISGWDTSSVDNMSNMFNGCTSFNQDLTGWNVSNLATTTGMFFNTPVTSSSIDADTGTVDISGYFTGT